MLRDDGAPPQDGQDFERSAHYRLSVIRLPLREADKRAAYRQGARLLQNLAEGSATFEDLAREHSDHPSAADDGPLDNLVFTGRHKTARQGVG